MNGCLSYDRDPGVPSQCPSRSLRPSSDPRSAWSSRSTTSRRTSASCIAGSMLSLRSLETSHEIVFVNDGSRDATAGLIDALQESDPSIVVVVHLSRNFGHQAAVSAGIDHARGRAVVVMDGDLQDPPEVIPQFVERWREGYDVVYAVRQPPQGRTAQAAGLLRLLSHPERDQRPGHPARQRRLLPDGPAGGRRAQALAREDAVRAGPAVVRRLPPGRAGLRAGGPRGRPAEIHLPRLVGLAIDGLVSFSSYPLAAGDLPGAHHDRASPWSCCSGSWATPSTTGPRRAAGRAPSWSCCSWARSSSSAWGSSASTSG